MAEDRFDGFDHTQYKEEVEQRWGKEAYAKSDRWWRGLTDADKQGFMQAHLDIAADWAALREQGHRSTGRRPRGGGSAPRVDRPRWGGRMPSADELVGLADMYVADERFAANYGGVEGATYVRDALTAYAVSELSG